MLQYVGFHKGRSKGGRPCGGGAEGLRMEGVTGCFGIGNRIYRSGLVLESQVCPNTPQAEGSSPEDTGVTGRSVNLYVSQGVRKASRGKEQINVTLFDISSGV